MTLTNTPEEQALKILELASIGCTPEEIVAELDLTLTTDQIIQTYGEILKRGSLKFKVAIRKAQMKLIERDAGLSRWLGTVGLGQDVVDPNKQSELDHLDRSQLLEMLVRFTETNTNVSV